MEVIVWEKKAWEAIELMLKESLAESQDYLKKADNPNKDRLMTIDEACEYVGFQPAWLKDRSFKLGVSKDGLYLKSKIDKYMESKSTKTQ